MRTTTACRACREKPVTDTFVCADCIDELHGHLHGAPDLARELNIEITKQARRAKGPSSHTPTFEQPMPINLAASDALDRLRFELVTACLAVTLGQRDRLPADTIGAMAAWLIEHEQSVALREEGGDICNGLASAVKLGRRLIDNPAERRYIGNCQTCAVERGETAEPVRMYARMGDAVHVCKVCGSEWGVQESFDRLEQELADYGLTRDELKTLLPNIPRKTLDNWIDRKPPKLTPQGTTAEGEPAYRYGDVLALDARRRERGKIRGAA